jgi:hypothetical protein
MGASGWCYSVEYETDIGAVLEKLRQQVFLDGDYYFSRDDDQPAPATIDELLWAQGTNGTHSILDIVGGVRTEPEEYWASVCPLSDEQVLDCFGTTEPDDDQVTTWMEDGEYDMYVTRGWWGVYVISYADGKPARIHFGGISGD